MATLTSTRDAPPIDAVQKWRLEQLEAAGFAPCEALVLSARQDVDLHVAVGLLRNGCPPQTALRILL